MRLRMFAVVFASLALAGCATDIGTSVGSVVSSVVVSATTAAPTQAKTVSEAEQATTLLEQGVDVYATTGNPSEKVKAELVILVTALHNDLKGVEDANAKKNSVLVAAALGTFNEGLKAVNAYESLNGVAH